MGHRISSMGAGKNLVEVKRERVDRHLFIWHSDEHADSIRMGQIVCKLDNGFRARRLNDLVRSLIADDLADFGINVSDLRSVEHMGRSARFGHFELPVHEINRHDRISTGQMRKLYNIETNTTDA